MIYLIVGAIGVLFIAAVASVILICEEDTYDE